MLDDELVKSAVENGDSLEAEEANDRVQERDLLLDRLNQCDVQVLSGNFQWKTRKPGSCSNIKQAGPLRDLFCCQSGKGVDKMFHDDFFSHCDTGQIDRPIPYLKLLQVDHELLHLISLKMNADSIGEFFKNRREVGDLFHVEQLRECICQVKRNVLESEKISRNDN